MLLGQQPSRTINKCLSLPTSALPRMGKGQQVRRGMYHVKKPSWNGHVPRCKIKIRVEVSLPPASCIVLDRSKSYLPNRDCNNHQDLIFWETVLSLPLLILQTMSCFTVYLKTCTPLQTSTCPAFLCINNFPLQVLVPACRIEYWIIVCLTLICITAFYFWKGLYL